ncbi:MAG: alpha/beta hydrolase [Rubrivivax sp.]|nr:alpha/beta hydrolase [Rubrivivax sp.]
MSPILLLALALAATEAVAAPAAPLQPCRLQGVEAGALCGQLQRPLDPARPDGTQIDLHYAVLPALARNKKPDPVFFFAGGPGQSAIELAGTVSALMTRLSNRRDVVLVDQRGTGRSAPLLCDLPAPAAPLRELADPARQLDSLLRCRDRLTQLPYGDLRQFTTTIAMADVDAVRQALGAERINLVGGSYGTRAALEYQRQFPQAVRRAVIDGVAPPDMVLPAAISSDAQAAFDALVQACAQAPDCAGRYPSLDRAWRRVRATLPREVTVRHPVTGEPERFTLTADMAAGLLRMPLYLPALTSALPLAITQADEGRFDALVGLASAISGGRRSPTALAEGMHYAVVCAEDGPRLAQANDAPGPDFGDSFARQYRLACANWPRGAVPEAFYTVPPAPAATLVLSGGIDPVTPPRHGERVARALGPLARHVVVPESGHGVLALGCMRDVLYRFIDAESDAQALQVDAGCVAGVPRPPAFQPVRGGGAP